MDGADIGACVIGVFAVVDFRDVDRARLESETAHLKIDAPFFLVVKLVANYLLFVVNSTAARHVRSGVRATRHR